MGSASALIRIPSPCLVFGRYLAVVCSFVLSSCRGKGGGRSSAAAATAAAAAAAPCFGWSGLCLLCFSVVGACCLIRTAASIKAHSYTCSILHFPVCSRISAAPVAAAAATAVAVLLEVLATCNNHTGKSRPHRFVGVLLRVLKMLQLTIAARHLRLCQVNFDYYASSWIRRGAQSQGSPALFLQSSLHPKPQTSASAFSEDTFSALTP